jgi:hypothetical protein
LLNFESLRNTKDIKNETDLEFHQKGIINKYSNNKTGETGGNIFFLITPISIIIIS